MIVTAATPVPFLYLCRSMLFASPLDVSPELLVVVSIILHILQYF